MKTIFSFDFYKFFGNRYPMFPIGLEPFDLERAKADAEARPRSRYIVYFRRVRSRWRVDRWEGNFSSVAEIVAYMRRWGLCSVGDLDRILELEWNFELTTTSWCVLCYDPFYGTVSSSQGYRRRFYFPTEADADAWAEKLGKNWVIFDIYPTQRRITFSAPYGNNVRVPFNNR